MNGTDYTFTNISGTPTIRYGEATDCNGEKIGTPVLTLEMQPLTQEELDLSFILRYDLVNKIILKYFNYHTLFYFYDLASSAFKSIIHAQCRM